MKENVPTVSLGHKNKLRCSLKNIQILRFKILITFFHFSRYHKHSNSYEIGKHWPFVTIPSYILYRNHYCRYRCVETYPSQSEIELDLKIGDVVFVHRKRDDGWFKGTLQRSGKMGLFPGSFVIKTS